jgi:hypothetical protein
MPGTARTACTASANRTTHSVSACTWSTRQIRRSPRRLAILTFSATVLVPSENSECTWKSSASGLVAPAGSRSRAGACLPPRPAWIVTRSPAGPRTGSPRQ